MMKKLFRFMPVAIVLMVGSAFAEITPTQPSAGDGTENNPFQITSAAELYWLAATVNNGECGNYASGNCSAKLIESITLNSNLLGEGNKNVEENGNFDWNGYGKAHNWNEPESWSPIGTGENPYQGTFNGNNKTVSGVFNSDVSSEVGFFGRVGENGVVKNVGVVDSYINCNMYCGGIVGENDGSVSGVSYAGVVNGGEDVGGIIGKNNGGASVRNVYKTGAVYGSNLVGGIVGDNGASINNAFNMGTVSGSYNVGGVAGQNSGSVSKAYYNTDVTCENCAVVEGTTGKTAAELATINLAEAFPLQGSEMENPWAKGSFFDKISGKLVNSKLPYLKNFPVVPDAETILSFTVASGVIQISTAEDLKNFAKLVNEYDIRDVDAELTTSITLNSNLLGENNANVKEDGTFDEDEYKKAHNGSAPESWTPIGTNDNQYTGTFDGKGYTVSGLYFNNESAECVGLFGAIGEYSKVQNVGVVDSYLRGKANVGGVVGYSYVGFVGNVYSTGFVRGSESVGGVVGCNYGGFVGNVYSTGFVSGSESVGGVVGYIFDGGVENAYYNKDVFDGNAIGDALAFDWNEGGFGDQKDFEVPENVKGATSAEFADGTVAMLLHDWCEMDGETCKEGGLNGSIWGQDLAAENSLPDFSGVVGFKYGSITFFNLNDGVADSASIDATAKAPVSIPKDIAVSKHVTFKRPFAVGYSTMMLPFSVSAENKPAELEFYSFDKVEEINGKYTASYNPVNAGSGLNAHTPYIVKNSGEDALSQVTFEGEFTLGTSVMPPPNSSSSAWKFNGTYEYKTWEEGDAGLGRTYGFAANDGVNDESIVGKFAKIAAGAYIYPMRAYLEYTAPAQVGRPAANGEIRTVASLPDEIDVVIVDKDEKTGEQTTKVIGTLNTRTGEFKAAADRYFDMKGRFLGNKKPTQKGAYYNNGKKVIVK